VYVKCRQQAIRERAYAIWKQEGRPIGKDLDHWLRAEAEIMRCIFCLKEKVASDEHVFPEAIGGTLVIRRVCNSCNSWLGTNIDAPLVDHPLVLMIRAQLRLPNKGGDIPDVIKKVFHIGTLADDLEQRVLTMTDPETGKIFMKLLYKRTSQIVGDGAELVSITIDESDKGNLGTIVQRERQRAGLVPLPADQLAKEVERIVANNHGLIENPTVHYSIPIDLTEYKRGLLKICYELAWRWLGDEFLSDLAAEKIRGAIFDGIPTAPDKLANGPRGMFTFGANLDPFSLWSEEPNANIGVLMRVGNQISLGVKIFSTMSGVVCVSDNAEKYPQFADKKGRFIAIDPISGKRRESTLAEETLRVIQTGRS